MNALVKTFSGIEYQSIPEPQIIDSHDVKVRIRSAAICRTDIYVAEGEIQTPENRVIGHEASGEVVSCGAAVKAFKPGDRVVINPLRSCRICRDCCENNFHLCQKTHFMGIDYDGAFAEFVVLPEVELYLLPEGVDEVIASYAEPVAATQAILSANLQKESKILVFGQGRIADLAYEVLADASYSHLSKGVDFNGEPYDVIVEACSVPDELCRCLPYLKPGGLLVLKSRHPKDIRFSSMELIQKRIRIESVYYGPFQEALAYVKKHKDSIGRHIGKQWRLDQFEKAFAEAKESESLKTYFDLS